MPCYFYGRRVAVSLHTNTSAGHVRTEDICSAPEIAHNLDRSRDLRCQLKLNPKKLQNFVMDDQQHHQNIAKRKVTFVGEFGGL